jgi:hypothetical protein
MPDPRPNIRKGIHIALMEDTHAGLRIKLFEKKLSMQETFEELAQLIAAGDPRLMRIIDGIVDRKKNRTVRSLSNTDAQTLLDVIDRESPFGRMTESDHD